MIYLDTSVFYHAYCPFEDSKSSDWILDELLAEYPGITSEWTIIEMVRALKKQVNLDRLTEDAATTTLDFFLSEIFDMAKRSQLELNPVSLADIIAARTHIFSSNLYSADALHWQVAIASRAKAFITFDSHFEGISKKYGLLLGDPKDAGFQEKLAIHLAKGK
ncbi:MAG: type II toxin-antitoxin system VapC family toxin [Candidatus Heimdallarchaeota archaeon]